MRSKWIPAILIMFGLASLLIACSPAVQPTPATGSAQPTVQQPAGAEPTTSTAAAEPASTARERVNLKLLSGPFATGGYNVAFGLSEIAAKNHPWLRIAAAESPGYIYNIKALNNPVLWPDTLIGTDSACKWLADKGDPLVGEQVTGIRIIHTIGGTNPHLVTMDPSIKTPADLEGKRIALGLRTQSWWGLGPALTLEHGWGITEKNADIQYLGPGPAKTALLDGRVDAAVMGIYSNLDDGIYARSAQLIELSSAPRPIYHIPWGKQQTEETRAKSGLPVVPVTLPAGCLPTITEDLEVWSGVLAFGAKDVFPDEYAYEIVKLVYQHYKTLGDYDEQGKLVTPQGMTFGWSLKDIHPGAVQAYKELGVNLPEE